MSIPVFDDVEPLPACGCEECARRRLTDSMARDTGGPATGATTRVVVVAAAAGTALGSAAGAVAAVPLPSEATAFTTGHAALAAAPATVPAATPLRLTRDQIIQRARTWADAKVPYSMTAYWKDGYRQDCSGFVSMAWGLGSSAWTGSLAGYGVRITKDELMPGDILLFHNAADPEHGSHTVIFDGWVDDAHTAYTGYEQTVPATRVQTTPYAYWSNSGKYIPYRYKYLAGGSSSGSGSGGSSSGSTAFPGTSAFGPGADNANVTRLGTMLVGRGASSYYKVGPGPKWSESDRGATSAFQRAQGWSGSDADGLPGPTTWSYLVQDKGRDISGAPRASGGTPAKVPAYPGAGAFRPGQTNDSVLALGKRLVAKGFGKNYTVGPSRTWGEADRRNVEAFQRSLGWTGRDADGYPGPETWRRLFT
ncbi:MULTISPECIES: peptidoglycan-binding protein [unclassified Streptomyces]|uniref:peptidoglycan-binding protein n=1 Tax=unclassified Streptomyces TaxID=2593676 RepID=UPI0033B27861